MISTNEFKTNVTVTIDGDAWQVVEFQHVKPGKGAAFVRAKMRNMCTGAVVERTFNAGERLPKAHIDRRAMQYLYESDGNYVFMDNETYEQSELTKEQLGNAINPKAMEQQAYTNLLSILIVLHFNRFVYLLKSTTG